MQLNNTFFFYLVKHDFIYYQRKYNKIEKY